MQEELSDLVKHALVPVKQVLEDYGRTGLTRSCTLEKEELEEQESMQEELSDLVKHALVPVKQVLEDYGRRSWRTMAA